MAHCIPTETVMSGKLSRHFSHQSPSAPLVPWLADGQGCARDCTLSPRNTFGRKSISISCSVAASATMLARACTSRQSLHSTLASCYIREKSAVLIEWPARSRMHHLLEQSAIHCAKKLRACMTPYLDEHSSAVQSAYRCSSMLLYCAQRGCRARQAR